MYKVIAAALLISLSTQLFASDKAKLVVGATAVVAISTNQDTVLKNYLARIDTGARISSIHAVDINIDGVAETGKLIAKQQIGKLVSFTTLNAKGEKQRLQSKITDVLAIRNAQGIEQRYVIELTLLWQGFEKTVAVNLRDRSSMNYKLLIGRNWLHNDVLVDVDINAGATEQ